MRYILSKTLILLACISLAVFTGDNSGSGKMAVNMTLIVAMLLSVILSNISAYYFDMNSKSKTNYIFNLLMCAYSLLTLTTDGFELFLPVIIYEIFMYKFYLAMLFCSAALFITTIETPYNAFILLVLCGVSILLAYLNNSVNCLLTKIHQMQDTAKEREILISNNTKQLIENQNISIYNATLQERNRIARDIHDNVGHMLTRAILQAGSIKVLNKDVNLAEPLNSLHETLNTAMTSMRNSVHDLYDESVDMRSSIEKIVNDINASSQDNTLTCTLYYDCGNVIPKNIKYAFIAIVKEAVNNTSKHSNADHIQISIDEHPGFYKLTVSDNGTSFHGNVDNIIKSEATGIGLDSTSHGIGLKNIYDRVKAIGGSVNISTSVGFKIMITIMKQD